MSRILVFMVLLALTAMSMSIPGDDVSHKEVITGPFSTPQDVTRKCIECHEDVAEAVLHSRHWNWAGDTVDVAGHGRMRIGKINLINNFCVALPSNYPRCTSCHPGYGWKDSTFDFTDPANIDCLVCHDRTGTYSKPPTAAGMPDPSVDLVYVAQNVGMPTISNCGACHFNGGGGTGVKHGDLDGSLLKATRELDVHMGGLGFTCTACHTTVDHEIWGGGHSSLASGGNRIACTDCHDNDQKPIHQDTTITRHLDRVACETCHIPEYAREMPTKMYWDWSTAGQREDEKDAAGNQIYAKMKGDFLWEEDVVPTYAWFNGSAGYYLPGDVIADTTMPVMLNRLNGDISDPDARIYPFKVMRGRQIYDTRNGYLIIPKLFGEGGYWKTYDWDGASRLGMAEAGLAYSGSYGFIDTEMYWGIHHMVTPKEEALTCGDCHGDQATRLNWATLGYKVDPAKR